MKNIISESHLYFDLTFSALVMQWNVEFNAAHDYIIWMLDFPS
jgi:hypothetical protein